MAISIVCDHCGRKLRAKDEYQGRRVKCPACQHELVISGDRARQHDVFISYSNADKTTADAVCAALEADGIHCWIAPRDILPGLDWSEGIIDAINDCRVMVLVFSSSSNESQQVRRELERALAKEVPILPFRIEVVPLSKSMEYFIGTQHWLDAMTPPLEQHLERLTDTVRRLLAKRGEGGSGHGPPPIPESAPAAEAGEAGGAAARSKRRPLLVTAGVIGLLLILAMVVFWPRRPPALPSASESGEASEAGWRPLFNGRDLTGWSELAAPGKGPAKLTSGRWSVSDGNIVCTGDVTGGLVADGQYSDFELALDFQLPADAMLLLVFRTPPEPKGGDKPPGIPIMHEALFRELLLKKGKGKTGELFIMQSLSDIAGAVRPPDQWNSLELSCKGDRVQLTLNAAPVVGVSLSEIYGKVPPAGAVALANPEGMAQGAAIRNIRIREIK